MCDLKFLADLFKKVNKYNKKLTDLYSASICLDFPNYIFTTESVLYGCIRKDKPKKCF